jgi:hypothetical protein
MKKFFTFCVALFFAAYAGSTFAASTVTLGVAEDVGSGDGWELQLNAAGTAFEYVLTDGADVTFTDYSEYETIIVPEGVSAKVTLSNAHILYNYGSPFVVKGNATIVLDGDNSLIVGNCLLPYAGIEVEDPASVTIKGDGTLRAYGAGTNGQNSGAYGGGAGIGASTGAAGSPKQAGTINIEGGVIIAQGGYNSCSIGGGYYGNNGAINISGGIIVAESIGGGSHMRDIATRYPINISGGVIYCTYALSAKVPSQDPISPLTITGNSVIFLGSNEVGNSVFESNSGSVVREGNTLEAPAKVYCGWSTYEGEGDDQIEIKHGVTVTGGGWFDVRDGGRDATHPAALTVSIELIDDIEIPAGTTLIVPSLDTPDGADIVDVYIDDADGSATIHNYGTIYANVYGTITEGTEGTIIGGDTYGEINASVTAIATPKVSAVEDVYYANGSVVVKAPAVKSVSVISLSGQTLLRTSKTSFSVESLPKGAYVVAVATANGSIVKKIVK